MDDDRKKQAQLLIRNLQHYADISDGSDNYQLNLISVGLLLEEIARLRGGAIPVYSFASLRDEIRADAARKKRIAEGIGAEVKEFTKDKDSA